MKPFTKLHVYFGKQIVNAYVTPASSGAIGTTHLNFSDVASPVAGSNLISDGVGNCEGTFTIPDPKISGNPRFATGDIEFVITADVNNAQVGDGANEIIARQTFADAIYSAKGTLDTQQETIIATRNAIVKTTALTENGGLILGSAIAPPPTQPEPQRARHGEGVNGAGAGDGCFTWRDYGLDDDPSTLDWGTYNDNHDSFDTTGNGEWDTQEISEFFNDYGLDGAPNTSDEGEGNGEWDGYSMIGCEPIVKTDQDGFARIIVEFDKALCTLANVDDEGNCTYDDFTASISSTLLIPEITTSEPLDILLIRSGTDCD